MHRSRDGSAGKEGVGAAAEAWSGGVHSAFFAFGFFVPILLGLSSGPCFREGELETCLKCPGEHAQGE